MKNPSPSIKNPKWSSQFKDFVSKTVDKDPEQRWTIDQLLGHPWLADAQQKRAAFCQELNAWKNKGTPNLADLTDAI